MVCAHLVVRGRCAGWVLLLVRLVVDVLVLHVLDVQEDPVALQESSAVAVVGGRREQSLLRIGRVIKVVLSTCWNVGRGSNRRAWQCRRRCQAPLSEQCAAGRRKSCQWYRKGPPRDAQRWTMRALWGDRDRHGPTRGCSSPRSRPKRQRQRQMRLAAN